MSEVVTALFEGTQKDEIKKIEIENRKENKPNSLF